MNKLEEAIKRVRSRDTSYVRTFDVLIFLQAACRQYGSQRNLAKEMGISSAYLNDVLNHRRNPGKKILDWLGLEKRTVYIDKRAENEET